MVTAVLLASVALLALVALAAAWPWRVEATLKANTSDSAISLAGGVDVAGLSASAAAILGGPGVVAIHFRARQVWRRSIARLSIETLLDWVQGSFAKQPSPQKSAAGRLVERAKKGLVSRTELSKLPGLGLRVVRDLREPRINGALTCGFSDPALTGKAAAWLFPIAGVLSPFGVLDVSFDWTGKNRVDGAVDLSFRVVPARVALEGLRFAWRHVHLRGRSAPASSVSSTMPAAIATITTG